LGFFTALLQIYSPGYVYIKRYRLVGIFLYHLNERVSIVRSLQAAHPQLHSASGLPSRAARIMALAQPTPLSTFMAPVTQFN
jgi:hypothetical protein